jgi:hypothetical protein
MCAETYTYESQPSSPHIKVFNPLYKLKDAGKDKSKIPCTIKADVSSKITTGRVLLGAPSPTYVTS